MTAEKSSLVNAWEAARGGAHDLSETESNNDEHSQHSQQLSPAAASVSQHQEPAQYHHVPVPQVPRHNSSCRTLPQVRSPHHHHHQSFVVQRDSKPDLDHGEDDEEEEEDYGSVTPPPDHRQVYVTPLIGTPEELATSVLNDPVACMIDDPSIRKVSCNPPSPQPISQGIPTSAASSSSSGVMMRSNQALLTPASIICK
jgi:hypothetical protein